MTITTIPLNQLVASKANARQVGKNDSVAELAASIAAHGLRQNLNVRPSEDGKRFEVVAGGRRLRALKLLAKQKTLAKDAPIACRVLDENDDPEEISLVENTQRLNMHPLDEFEAFRSLIEDKRMSVEDVAARFGVMPNVVQRRLKLANVSPKLRALYRKDEIDLEQLMAFAIVDDHAAQEDAWASLAHWNSRPRDIRAHLTREAVEPTDKLARFVGVETYIEAGGAVLRDLFTEDDEAYLTDRPLLLRLATEKLDAAMEALREEGWKWVTAEIEPDHSVHYRYVDPQPVEEGEDERYAPEDMARAGVRVRLGYDGALSVTRGLVHPDDVERDPEETHAKAAKAAPGDLPATVIEDLTAHRTAALRIELARNPAIALAAAVHALSLSLLYRTMTRGCLDLRGSSEPLERHTQAFDESPAHKALADEAEAWGSRLPGDPSDLFAWCLAQSQDELLALLAFLAALSVNAVHAKHDPLGDRHSHADALADALSLDMTAYWTPSVEGFYGRVCKATLINIVSEAKAPMQVSIAALKKQEAARYVAKAMQDRPLWLPAPLRPLAAAPVEAVAA